MNRPAEKPIPAIFIIRLIFKWRIPLMARAQLLPEFYRTDSSLPTCPQLLAPGRSLFQLPIMHGASIPLFGVPLLRHNLWFTETGPWLRYHYFFFSFLFSPLVVVVAVATRTAASAISRSVLTNSLPLQRRTSLKMRENIPFFFKVHHLQLPMHYVQMFSGAHTLLMIIWRDAASSSANDGVLPSIRSILIYFT